MRLTIKLGSLLLVLAGLLGCLLYMLVSDREVVEPVYQYDVLAFESGYAYQITLNNKVCIYQPYVPAVEGRLLFWRQEDAAKVAALVVARLQRGKAPVISEEDLADLEVRVLVPAN